MFGMDVPLKPKVAMSTTPEKLEKAQEIKLIL